MPGHNVSPFASPLPISPQLQLQNLFSDGCLLLQASAVCLRAPVSESLSRLQRDQLQKFAQYLISELPQQVGEVGTSHCWLSVFASGLFSAFLFHTGLFGFTCALFSLPLFFPPQILPTAQRLLDELLSSQSTAINTVCGAPGECIEKESKQPASPGDHF